MVAALISMTAFGGAFAQEPTEQVRAARAESNAAIAAHDPIRLRKIFQDDFHLIKGSSGKVYDSADAMIREFTDAVFSDPTFITYVRTPDAIQVSSSGKRIAESGRWIGKWNKPSGAVELSGVYLAMWTTKEGHWLLKSEAFVTLACSGGEACKDLD
jgi:hypothetical protein